MERKEEEYFEREIDSMAARVWDHLSALVSQYFCAVTLAGTNFFTDLVVISPK